MYPKIIAGGCFLIILWCITFFWGQSEEYQTIKQAFDTRSTRNKEIHTDLSGTIYVHIDPRIFTRTSVPNFSGITTYLSGGITHHSGTFVLNVYLRHELPVTNDAVTGLLLNYHLQIIRDMHTYINISKRHSNNTIKIYPTLFLREQFIKSYDNTRIMIDTQKGYGSGFNLDITPFVENATTITFGNLHGTIKNRSQHITPRKLSASYTIDVEYQSMITGTIFINITSTPRSFSGITIPSQTIPRSTIQAILQTSK